MRTNLRSIEKQAAELASLQGERRVRLKLEDVLAAQSKKTLDTAFQRVSAALGADVARLESAKHAAEASVRKFEDKERQKLVLRYYTDQLRSLSNLLNVPPEEQIRGEKSGSRAHTGGSSRPRSLLAVHLALLATNAEWGEAVQFPFIVDTPQQSGQDDENLGKMISILGRSAKDDHQVILAAERLPVDVDLGEFVIVNLEKKRGVLDRNSFGSVWDRLILGHRSRCCGSSCVREYRPDDRRQRA
ncbi:hypothetical protein [Paraburkholderia sp. SIMBA_054]|uniref:hypothetical protein n=1 Tax=Paraburkholderia sp. SIMBA_054 TaxID=3085795 RepID=UPI00397E2571